MPLERVVELIVLNNENYPNESMFVATRIGAAVAAACLIGWDSVECNKHVGWVCRMGGQMRLAACIRCTWSSSSETAE